MIEIKETHSMTGQGLRRGAARVWRKEDHRPQESLIRAAQNIDYKYWVAGDLQDQGQTPQCVEYAGRGLLECSPARNQTEGIWRGSIYQWCQAHDEWPGEDYEGTSVHALMKWMQAQGYVTSYQWATSVDEVHAHLMTRGPAIFGTTWTKNMSYVDEFGYARFSGENYGGHAYLIRGGNRLAKDPVTGTLGKAKLRNSWGLEYAEAGEAWLSYADIQKLIDDDGEIALPVERLVKRG